MLVSVQVFTLILYTWALSLQLHLQPQWRTDANSDKSKRGPRNSRADVGSFWSESKSLGIDSCSALIPFKSNESVLGLYRG